MKTIFKSVVGLFFALMMMLAAPVYAVVPVGVDTAVTAAQTDAVTVAGYVLIALAGLVAIKWMIHIIRKA